MKAANTSNVCISGVTSRWRVATEVGRHTHRGNEAHHLLELARLPRWLMTHRACIGHPSLMRCRSGRSSAQPRHHRRVAEGSERDLEAWDNIAAAYAQQVGAPEDLTYTRFREFIWRNLGESLGRLSVLDLGCGPGWLTKEIDDRGGNVVGVDGSRTLLNIARERYPDLDFVEADLADGLPAGLSNKTYDRILCHMVAMDIPDLEPLAASLTRCTTTGTRLVVTITHPAFFWQSPHEDPESGERYRKVRGYLEHEEWWVGGFGGHRHYHRPLSFYVEWMRSAGFVVTELFEPPVPRPTPVDEWTDYDRWLSAIPTMLGLVGERVTPGRGDDITDPEFPTKRVGAGLLITDERGRVLLVKPTYKDGWEIPGGLVEDGESPREAAAREVHEELGLRLQPGSLLVVHYSGPNRWPSDGVMFIFDGGEISDPASIRLPAGELASFRFVPPDDLSEFVHAAMNRRLRAALTARADGVPGYLER